MSNAIFQPPKGLGWSVRKRPTWSSEVQTATSGRQVRAAFYSYPIWEYEMVWSYLKGGEQSAVNTANDLEALMGFYMARQGGFDSFLYSDPNDNSVAMEILAAAGDGVTTAFQLTRTIGSGNDIVQNLDQTVSALGIWVDDFQNPKNLCTNSENFANWAFDTTAGLTSPTVTPNGAFAPDGSNNAAKITFPASGAGENMVQQDTQTVPLASEAWTFSIWLRADSAQSVNIRLVQSTGQNDTLLTANVTTIWQRFSLSLTTGPVGTGDFLARLGLSGSTNAQATVYVWGAQVELGSTATTYQKTGVAQAVPVGPTQKFGSSRTNEVLWSQAFDNTAWALNNITRPTADTVVAPDGTTTAEALSVITNGLDSYTSQSIGSPSSYNNKTVTFSVWLKVPSGTLSNLNLYITYTTGGTFTSPFTQVNLTTRWKKFSFTVALGGSLTTLAPQIGGGSSFTSGTIDCWGAQLEIGSSATSYIATTNAAVSITDVAVSATGIATFAFPPALNSFVRWSGNYFFRLRFQEDNMDFEQFMYQLWELKSVKLESVIL